MKVLNVLNPKNLISKIKKASNKVNPLIVFAAALDKSFITVGMEVINAKLKILGIELAPKTNSSIVRIIQGISSNNQDEIIKIYAPKLFSSTDLILYIKPASFCKINILNAQKQITRSISSKISLKENGLIRIVPSEDSCFIQGVSNE